MILNNIFFNKMDIKNVIDSFFTLSYTDQIEIMKNMEFEYNKLIILIEKQRIGKRNYKRWKDLFMLKYPSEYNEVYKI